jgi:hypothetical protein
MAPYINMTLVNARWLVCINHYHYGITTLEAAPFFLIQCSLHQLTLMPHIQMVPQDRHQDHWLRAIVITAKIIMFQSILYSMGDARGDPALSITAQHSKWMYPIPYSVYRSRDINTHRNQTCSNSNQSILCAATKLAIIARNSKWITTFQSNAVLFI